MSGKESKGTGTGRPGKAAFIGLGLRWPHGPGEGSHCTGADKGKVRQRLKTIGYSDKQLDGAYFKLVDGNMAGVK